MKHLWSVLCRHASVDKDSNLLSLLDVVEAITMQFQPTVPDPGGAHVLPIPMELVTHWGRDTKQAKADKFRIIFRTPRDPQPQMQPEGTVEFPPGESRIRTIAKVQGFIWRGMGTYTYLMQVHDKGGWKTVAEIPFELKPAPTPTVAPILVAASRKKTRKRRKRRP